MNALSPFSTLIAPPPAGRIMAGGGLVAPIETVEAPDGFAGWLPQTLPPTSSSAPSPASLAGTGLTNMGGGTVQAMGQDSLARLMTVSGQSPMPVVVAIDDAPATKPGATAPAPAPAGLAGSMPTSFQTALRTEAMTDTIAATVPVDAVETPASPSRPTPVAAAYASNDMPAAAAVDPASSDPTPPGSPAPKPIGKTDTADLRLPMVSITVSPTGAATTRSFVPKTMPISDATPFPSRGDARPAMVEGPALSDAMPSGAALSPATIPDAVDPAAIMADASAPMADTIPAQPVSAAIDAMPVVAKPPSKVSLAGARTLPATIPAVADPLAKGTTTDRVMDAEPADPSSPPGATAGRRARTAKPAEDRPVAPLPPVSVDAVLPLPPGQPVAAPPPRADIAESEGDGQEHASHAVAGRSAPVAQAVAAPAPAANAADPMPAADAATTETGTGPTMSSGDAAQAAGAVSNDSPTPDRVTGEARAATPAPSSFRAQIEAVQQANRPQPAPAQPAPPVVQAGHIGQDTAVAIARHVARDGGETMTVRIAPAELGRIEIRLAFDDGGTLRATVAADQPASLDLLRRDTDSLVRALGDAGVRADSDSLRFDTRPDGGASTGGFASSGQSGGGGGQGRRTPFSAGPYPTPIAGDEPAVEKTRTLSSRGRVDLMA